MSCDNIFTVFFFASPPKRGRTVEGVLLGLNKNSSLRLSPYRGEIKVNEKRNNAQVA